MYHAPSSRWIFRGGGWRRLAVLDDHPDRRRLQVIELAAACGPHKGGHGRPHDEQGKGQDQVDDAHGSRRKVWPYQAPATTVRELSGIMIAATTGVMVPVMASQTPTAL